MCPRLLGHNIGAQDEPTEHRSHPRQAERGIMTIISCGFLSSSTSSTGWLALGLSRVTSVLRWLILGTDVMSKQPWTQALLVLPDTSRSKPGHFAHRRSNPTRSKPGHLAAAHISATRLGRLKAGRSAVPAPRTGPDQRSWTRLKAGQCPPDRAQARIRGCG